MYPNQGQPNQGMYGQGQQQYYPQNGSGFNQQGLPSPTQQQAYDQALVQQTQNQHLAGSPVGGSGLPLGVGGAQQRPRTAGSLGSVSRDDDYVTIPRNPDVFQPITRERATACKLKIELFYKQNVQHALERNQRLARSKPLSFGLLTKNYH